GNARAQGPRDRAEGPGRKGPPMSTRKAPGVERLESRDLPSLTAVLAGGGVLSVVGGPGRENIAVLPDPARGDLVVYDFAQEAARVPSSAVNSITVDGTAGSQDRIRIGPDVPQPALIEGAPGGGNVLIAGGGPTTI